MICVMGLISGVWIYRSVHGAFEGCQGQGAFVYAAELRAEDRRGVVRGMG